MCVLSGDFSFKIGDSVSVAVRDVGIHAEGNTARLEEQWRQGGACTLHVYARGRREAVRRIKTIGAANLSQLIKRRLRHCFVAMAGKLLDLIRFEIVVSRLSRQITRAKRRR